ncbi:MAG: YjbQ family protein [Pseudomonadota bacterium]
MILLKNYFVNTTSDVDVMTIIHEVNQTITESKAQEGSVNISVPEAGGALALIEPLPDIIEQFKEALRIFPGEGVRTKDRRKQEIDIGPRIAAAMLGKAMQIPLSKGKLVLGVREEPVLIDLEKAGKRREFYVQVIAEPAGGAQAGQAAPGQRQQR